MSKTKKSHHKIAVNFPADVFDKIKRRAEADNVSVSTKAVELIRCGIMDYEDSEQFEPQAQRAAPQ